VKDKAAQHDIVQVRVRHRLPVMRRNLTSSLFEERVLGGIALSATVVELGPSWRLGL